MINFRGDGALALIGFIVSIVLVAGGARVVLGSAAADIPTAIVIGVAVLVSAAVTGLLAVRGMRGGVPNRGRHEVAGIPLERIALLEVIGGIVAIAFGVIRQA